MATRSFLGRRLRGGGLAGGRLSGRRLGGVSGGGSSSARGGSGFTLGRLLFLLLGLLHDDLDDLHLGQPERASALLPALLVLELQDALAALEHVAGTLQRVLTAKTFIDGHDWQ